MANLRRASPSITLSDRRVYNWDMTLIAAGIINDKVVITADGRTFEPNTGEIINDETKLFHLIDSIHFAVAVSHVQKNDMDLIVEHFKIGLKHTPVFSEKELVERFIEYIKPHAHSYKGYKIRVLLGGFFNTKSFLYLIESSHGYIPKRINENQTAAYYNGVVKKN
jgi:hypothetical protein